MWARVQIAKGKNGKRQIKRLGNNDRLHKYACTQRYILLLNLKIFYHKGHKGVFTKSTKGSFSMLCALSENTFVFLVAKNTLLKFVVIQTFFASHLPF